MDDKKRILIIENDEEMRFLLKGFVDKEGYEADFVEKGTYAFKKLITESFSLIITDIQDPGFSGLDILPGLKKLQPGDSYHCDNLLWRPGSSTQGI